jgi:hypothetical protein
MKASVILFVLCLLGWFVGLTGLGGEVATGFALAMGSVFFVLAYITRFIAKAEATQS